MSSVLFIFCNYLNVLFLVVSQLNKAHGLHSCQLSYGRFRDIPGILPRPGHRRDRAQIPGLSRPFRDGWQLWA